MDRELPGPGRRHALRRTALRNPRVLGLISGFFAVCTWLAFSTKSIFATNVFWLFQIPCDGLFFWSAMLVARHPSVDAADRRFWRLTTGAAAAFVTGDIIRTFEGFAGLQTYDSGAVQTACFVLGQSSFVVALAGYPALAGSGSARVRFLLDAAIVVCGSAAVIWYLLTAPGSDDAASLDVISGLLVGAEVLMVGFLAVKLILSGRAPTTPAASASMIMAGVVQVLLTTVLPVYEPHMRYGLVLSIQLIPGILIAMGPILQSLSLRLQPEERRTHRRRPYSLLPYLAVSVVYLLLLMALDAQDNDMDRRTLGLVLGVGLVVGLVIWRQLLSATENARLIAELDRSLQELHEQKERFRSLVAHSSDITLVVNERNLLTYASPAAERVLGFRPEQLVGMRFDKLLHPDDVHRLLPEWGELTAKPGRATTMQGRVKSIDRGWRWLEMVNTNLLNDPVIRGVVCNGRDITDARELQDRLVYQASHDVLTKLANRRLFSGRLASAASADTDDGQVALLMIDLDGFKPINDTHGHQVGDAVLIAVAERIRRCVRPTDTAARLGGDEFAVLMPGSTLEQARKMADRFLAALSEPVSVGSLQLSVGASVGVTVGSATDSEALLRRADDEMYAVKRQRRHDMRELASN